MGSGSDKTNTQIEEKLKCSACGAVAVREGASYCLICGKLLNEDYQPLDNLRSSYRLQGRAFLVENTGIGEIGDLFAVNRNSASEMAWACFVYSLVPYLGILFIPFTLLIGFAGFGVFIRRPRLGGGRLAAVSIGLSVIVLGVQIVLWWLLYIIPTLNSRI